MRPYMYAHSYSPDAFAVVFASLLFIGLVLLVVFGLFVLIFFAAKMLEFIFDRM